MSEEKAVPRVRVRRQGRVTDTLNRLAEAYKAKNEGMAIRWVYDPTHRPELSAVMGRLAQGYRRLTGADLQDSELLDVLGLKAKEPIRVGDVVLMGIAESERDAIKQEVQDSIDEQIRSIDRKFYDEIDRINIGDRGKELTDGQRPRPRGRSVIEEREFEFDYVQKTGGGET